MPLELGIWRIDGETRAIVPVRMDREERLESIVRWNDLRYPCTVNEEARKLAKRQEISLL